MGRKRAKRQMLREHGQAWVDANDQSMVVEPKPLDVDPARVHTKILVREQGLSE
jgi:hypothetical protein